LIPEANSGAKREFSVKRNLLKKAFAYLRGSVSVEQKISHLREKNKSLNAKNAMATGFFGIK